LTISIGVLHELEASPSSTQPPVRPSRLIGIPTVSCFTASLVPSNVGPLPSGTMKGVAVHLRVRPSLCTAYAPRPAVIAATARTGTRPEMTLGKRQTARTPQPRIQIDNIIPTNAIARFPRRLAIALPAPALVSVR